MVGAGHQQRATHQHRVGQLGAAVKEHEAARAVGHVRRERQPKVDLSVAVQLGAPDVMLQRILPEKASEETLAGGLEAATGAPSVEPRAEDCCNDAGRDPLTKAW